MGVWSTFYQVTDSEGSHLLEITKLVTGIEVRYEFQSLWSDSIALTASAPRWVSCSTKDRLQELMVLGICLCGLVTPPIALLLGLNKTLKKFPTKYGKQRVFPFCKLTTMKTVILTSHRKQVKQETVYNTLVLSLGLIVYPPTHTSELFLWDFRFAFIPDPTLMSTKCSAEEKLFCQRLWKNQVGGFQPSVN